MAKRKALPAQRSAVEGWMAWTMMVSPVAVFFVTAILIVLRRSLIICRRVTRACTKVDPETLGRFSGSIGI
jgi:hypothetical protein